MPANGKWNLTWDFRGLNTLYLILKMKYMYMHFYIYIYIYICILFYMYAFVVVDCVSLSIFNKIRPGELAVHFMWVTVPFFH